MKRVWLGRKFSYIFEARPSNNLALFMQSLYNHSISYLDTTKSLSHKLGGLYILYFLYETQPFKPPFKIYLSLGDLQRLKALVVNAKENGIKVVSVLVKRMLEKNTFLFGFVNINEYSEKERIKELVDAQNACIQKMHEKLLANTEIEQFLHMDMGMELDLKVLQNMSTEYEATKSLAVRVPSIIRRKMADGRTRLFCEIVLAIILPPLSVFLRFGCCTCEFLICVLLTLLGYIPGIIYAIYAIVVKGNHSHLEEPAGYYQPVA